MSNRFKRSFSLIELLLVVVISVFMVWAVALFTLPIVEVFNMTKENTAIVDESRYFLNQIFRELQKESGAPELFDGGSRVSFNDGTAFRLSGGEAPFQLIVTRDGKDYVVCEHVGLFEMSIETKAARVIDDEVIEGFSFYRLRVGILNAEDAKLTTVEAAFALR